MKIIIDTKKTVEQNAAIYFERAKKARKKTEGAKRAISIAQLKMDSMTQEQRLQEEKKKIVKVERKREWYEKFRWFISSDGFLCIGGRDSTTNEIVVKKHSQKGDIVLHTDMSGSPFIVIKSDGKEIPMATVEEAAQFCACYCRAWKLGMASLEVFYVAPEQLSKEPNAGESLPKGAFVVRGSVKYVQPTLELTIGKALDGRVITGAQKSVLKHAGSGYTIMQGTDKTSDVAKKLSLLLKADVDDIVSMLPSGGVKLGKEVKPHRMM